jgi:hypothetical protein
LIYRAELGLKKRNTIDELNACVRQSLNIAIFYNC